MKKYSRDIDNFFSALKSVDQDGFVLDHHILFPLYSSESLPPAKENRALLSGSEITFKIANRTGLAYTDREEEVKENTSPVCYVGSPEIREEFQIPVPRSTFSFVDIVDYVYALVHSSACSGSLGMDYLTVSYPKTSAEFWELAKTGREIRDIHMLKSSALQDTISYPQPGNNVVKKDLTNSTPGFVPIDKESMLGRIWINEQQYFDKVPLKAWEFSMGGYRPAQQWLQDREGIMLTPEDILHYRKMLAALDEIQRLIKKSLST